MSLDADAEGRYRLEPADRLTPEQLFERRWALTVLAHALARLRQERARGARTGIRAAEALPDGRGTEDALQGHVAALRMSESAVKTSPPQVAPAVRRGAA